MRRRVGRVARLAGVTLAAAAAGCLPWTLGEGAETVAVGRIEPGLGLAALAPPDALDRPLPVPQLWAATGLGGHTDAAVAYAVPLTVQARVKRRVLAGSAGAGAAALGFGVHGLPDVAGAGRRFWVPYATAAIHGSGRGEAPRLQGAVRAIVPFRTEDEFVATLWIAPQIGLELERGGWRWGPELGAVIPTLRPGDGQLVIAVFVRTALSLP